MLKQWDGVKLILILDFGYPPPLENGDITMRKAEGKGGVTLTSQPLLFFGTCLRSREELQTLLEQTIQTGILAIA